MPSPDYPGYNTTLVPQPGLGQSGEATDGLDAGLRPSRLSTARPPPPPRQGALAAMAGSQYSSDRAASGTAAGKAGIPTDFSPDSVRILVVDDDQVCLRTVEKMLRQCYQSVHSCTSAVEAVKILKGKEVFDLVLSDVHMPDMDGLKLLEVVGLELEIPVIMMSSDSSFNMVLKGVMHGACDYLIKPIRSLEVKNLWQHIWRKKVQPDEGDAKKKSANPKKPRVVWTPELHKQFVDAVNVLGLDKAVPKRILDIMEVPNLTRENVASHLQKYRLYLKRLRDQGGVPQPKKASNRSSTQSVWGTVPAPSLTGLPPSESKKKKAPAAGKVKADPPASKVDTEYSENVLMQQVASGMGQYAQHPQGLPLGQGAPGLGGPMGVGPAYGVGGLPLGHGPAYGGMPMGGMAPGPGYPPAMGAMGMAGANPGFAPGLGQQGSVPYGMDAAGVGGFGNMAPMAPGLGPAAGLGPAQPPPDNLGGTFMAGTGDPLKEFLKEPSPN